MFDTNGDGTYETPGSGETITFTLESGSVGSMDPASPAPVTTDVDGEATVDVTSSEMGTSTVSASWNGTVNGVSGLSASDSGVKTWVDTKAKLEVTPPEATNQINTTHTFTATLSLDEDGNARTLSSASVEMGPLKMEALLTRR